MTPTFALADHILIDAYIDGLSRHRHNTNGNGAPISKDPWAWENGKADAYGQLVHFAVWSLVLIGIECGLFSCICCCGRNSRTCCRKSDRINKKEVELDSDVQAE